MVGLEFLSRGASQATFVEKDPKAVQALRQLLQAWQAESQATVIAQDVLTFLSGTPQPMDFIFAGPPFRYWQKKTLLEKLLTGGWLRKGGCCILEHPTYESYADYPGFWRSERYVASQLSFFLG